MKLAISVFFALAFLFGLDRIHHQTPLKRLNRWLVLTIGAIIIFGLIGFLIHRSDSQPDKQCLSAHQVNYSAPTNSKTAQDFFELGNYQYDSGECIKAIASYTRAIEMNLNFAEAYNNRAYTNMRRQDYANALPDLDQAIKLRPNYTNALMNRGDIYNFYLKNKDRAIADYDRVIAQGSLAYQGMSVCGHRQIAVNGGMRPIIFWNLLTSAKLPGC